MKYAICNETFEGWTHEATCAKVAELGYQGLEIAPFTLANRITEVSSEARQRIRLVAEQAHLECIGLHWLLAKTEGFSLTSPDESIRERTGHYLADLAIAARDLGGSILVLGSPLQRKIPAGYSRLQADEFALDTLKYCLRTLEKQEVDLCLEPLTDQETDFINTAAEAVGMIQRLGHPRVRLHLDVKAMAGEPAPMTDVIRANAEYLRHFHANDPNRRGPGTGAVDFRPLFSALKQIHYAGWVSVEVFDYSPDPVTIARESLHYMRLCEGASA